MDSLAYCISPATKKVFLCMEYFPKDFQNNGESFLFSKRYRAGSQKAKFTSCNDEAHMKIFPCFYKTQAVSSSDLFLSKKYK